MALNRSNLCTSAQQETTYSPPSSQTTGESNAALKTAFRKTDLRLVAWYAFVLLVLRVEAHNIANAAIMNIEAGTDIQRQLGNLTSEQWALILSAPTYLHIVFEPVSTLLMKKFSPRRWMSSLIITWGGISMCHSATQNFGGLLACRFVLGLAEAGYLPAVLYHLSFWYPVDRLPLRLALLVGLSQLSGTVSGLLAYAISFLNGKAGLAGWRYLFILEGIPAILCGTYSLFFLPNYPEEATFLSTEERSSAIANLPNTQPSSNDKTWDWRQVKVLFTDWVTYLFMLIWVCHAIGARGINSVLPTVVYQLGLTGTATTQLMTMPPYVLGAAGLVSIAWLIRLNKLRSWVAALALEAFGLVCHIVLITVQTPLVRYIFIILASTSSFGVCPILWPERIRAVHGTTSAGLAIGITSAAAGLQGIIGPQIYQKSFGPTYKIPFTVSVGLGCATIISIVSTWILVRKRDGKLAEVEGKQRSGVDDTERIDSKNERLNGLSFFEKQQ